MSEYSSSRIDVRTDEALISACEHDADHEVTSFVFLGYEFRSRLSREVHVRFCESRGCDSPLLLTSPSGSSTGKTPSGSETSWAAGSPGSGGSCTR